MMLDLDHFKTINDRYGHLAGDELLRQAGVRTRCALRRGDIICRYGGDEFAAILPDCDASQAVAIAERIRRAMAETPFSWSGGAEAPSEISLTLTIGIALGVGESTTKDELIARADRELYRAKESGRNTISISPAIEPPEVGRAAAEAATIRPGRFG
jgi:diguanylate cyclase (GGDEF)-like protein